MPDRLKQTRVTISMGLLLMPCVLVNCGGKSSSTGTEATLVPSLDGGPPRRCGVTASTASPGIASVTTPPVYHRSAGTCCPTGRPAGNDGMPGNDGCLTDSECDAGVNGRCLSFQQSLCSYDECFSDVDCPPRVPCVCRVSASDRTPNVCAAASDCSVDSDCGPGGWCSPSPGPNSRCYIGTFHCHTPSDLCINDGDCSSFDAGTPPIGGIYTHSCEYNNQAHAWACGPYCLINAP